jgi:uncharacterized protein (DUF1501 family)
MELSRRGILKMLGGTALVTATLGDAQLAFGATTGTKANVLVTIVLGGGIDGLSVVVPNGDPDYAPNRPGIGVPGSTTRKIDTMFGLHPALSPLFPLWQSGKFAAVQAVGQESPTRSHFEAMDELERAAPGSSLRTGWLDRTIGMLPSSGALEAVSLGQSGVPGLLRGPHAKIAAGRLDDVKLPVDANFTPLPQWQTAIGQLHAGARPEVSAPMGSALDAIAAVGAVPPAATGTTYPDNSWGVALKDVARLVKADSGLRVATVPYGGWDHHENFGSPTGTGGTFAGRLSGLATGLAAFAADLGPDFDRVTVCTMTEFGRRVKENGSGGLDHGHGFCVLLLGGGVNGGKVYGRWPGLATANLDSKLDLAVTTDYRSIISEILTARMGVGSVGAVFPGFSATPLGAVRSG